MIGRKTRVLLQHYREEGASKAEVARRLGVSHPSYGGPLDRLGTAGPGAGR